MHRCDSLRARVLRVWPVLAAFGLVARLANGEEAPGLERDVMFSLDAGLAGGSGAEVDAGGTDGALESSDAAAPEPSVESPADDLADAGTGSRVALTLFGDPDWEYSPPTFEACFTDPVVTYWVEGVSPPEGTPCELER